MQNTVSREVKCEVGLGHCWLAIVIMFRPIYVLHIRESSAEASHLQVSGINQTAFLIVLEIRAQLQGYMGEGVQIISC